LREFQNGQITKLKIIRTAKLKENHFDIILVVAVLHRLRNDRDLESTFIKPYKLLSPGGCLMISDLIIQDNELLVEYMHMLERYEDYLKKV
jgi:tRNA (cmo5U34)-methyltransferase